MNWEPIALGSIETARRLVADCTARGVDAGFGLFLWRGRRRFGTILNLPEAIAVVNVDSGGWNHQFYDAIERAAPSILRYRVADRIDFEGRQHVLLRHGLELDVMDELSIATATIVLSSIGFETAAVRS